MITPDYVRLMAAYTCWQNDSVYAAAATLSDEARCMHRGAFFGSIHATLNHLLWGDQLWMHRLAGTDAPEAKSIGESTTQFPQWDALVAARRGADKALSDWAATLQADALEGDLGWYSAAAQADITRSKQVLVIQMLNHGTHHRGQVHGMLTAAGASPADTDVPFMPAPYFYWD